MITVRGTVYPWQCDHVGHLNVMWYVAKFDEGTWNLLAELGLTPAYMREQQRGMAAVQQNISYRRELHAGDVIEVRTRLLEVREKVIRFEHAMHDRASGELAAVCELTAVHIDATTRKSCALPDAARRAAEALLERRAS